MNCSEIRLLGFCRDKKKAMDCPHRGPFVRPTGHTCHSAEIHDEACRVSFQLEMSEAVCRRGNENEYDSCEYDDFDNDTGEGFYHDD